MNIAEILPRTAKRLPDKAAFVFNDQPTNYKTLQDLTEALAHGLQKLGLKKGDRVAVFAPSSLEFVVSWFSVVKLGAVFVPVNIMLKARESEYILGNAEVNTLIVHQSQGEIIQSIRC